jgi:hypothetical protein
MPRDSRLYMTFPIDMHRHPKLQRLDPAIRWTFVEMNGEARIADNDGRFTADEAEYLWPIEHLDALVRSHPTKPLVYRDPDTGDYVIREYAKHQQTRSAREELSRKRSEAGRRGGLAKSQANASQVPSPIRQTQAESESEDYYLRTKSQSSSKRARDSTDSLVVSAMTQRLAGQRGIASLEAIADSVAVNCRLTIDADQAYQLAVRILDRAKQPPAAPERYVLAAIKKSPAEVQKFLYESVGVAS